ncbi:hypothetical protein KIPB_010412 [Kipferlia bialata]|uniref:Helicase C-terminal domain-containing protein n=1 Tax=Kipferlia bialata TaxID=797122 RepID=A0A391P5V2_9EUKA|nr:hypothetical protein KIPB_010412 [Kipferlia bialata]|eukprot:g10412.t1
MPVQQTIQQTGHLIRFRDRGSRVGVFKFHGSLTDSQRKQVLNYSKHQLDRVIIFATNVAETGITIPDCRYVVDSGLAQRVKWNPELGCQELRTAFATRSSLDQRKGRAGRTASGICVRLYSEQDYKNSQQASDDNCDQDVAQTLLRLLEAEEKGRPIELPQPIPAAARSEAIGTLMELGALDKRMHVTKEGRFMLALGIGIRLSAFLLACNKAGCLWSGTIIAAMVSVFQGSGVTLLPSRATLGHTASNGKATSTAVDLGAIGGRRPIYKYIHASGDHLTLLKMFNAYTKTKTPTTWCNDTGIQAEKMRAVELSLDATRERLVRLGYSMRDNATKYNANGGLERSLLRALCVGFFDQLGVLSESFKPWRGVTRLLPVAKVGPRSEALSRFAAEVGGVGSACATAPEDGIGIRLNPRSVVYKSQEVAEENNEEPGEGYIVVFDSQMMVDSNPVPSAQLASYLSTDDLQALNPE